MEGTVSEELPVFAGFEPRPELWPRDGESSRPLLALPALSSALLLGVAMVSEGIFLRSEGMRIVRNVLTVEADLLCAAFPVALAAPAAAGDGEGEGEGEQGAADAEVEEALACRTLEAEEELLLRPEVDEAASTRDTDSEPVASFRTFLGGSSVCTEPLTYVGRVLDLDTAEPWLEPVPVPGLATGGPLVMTATDTLTFDLEEAEVAEEEQEEDTSVSVIVEVEVIRLLWELALTLELVSDGAQLAVG